MRWQQKLTFSRWLRLEIKDECLKLKLTPEEPIAILLMAGKKVHIHPSSDSTDFKCTL